MNYHVFARGLSVFAGLLTVSVVMPAAVTAKPPIKVACCNPGPPTAESYKWNFHSEATGLLRQIQAKAATVRDQADKMYQWQREGTIVDFRPYSDKLELLRENVNDMSAMLCRLNVIRPVALPWQKTAAAKLTPEVNLLAIRTQAAIQYLNLNEGLVAMPMYGNYLAALYKDSCLVATNTSDVLELASAHHEVRHLTRDLGLKAHS